jgi:prevent-host-death family protein
MTAYNLYEAKTSLSRLVDRAANGEEIVIAKAGKPMVKMVPIAKEKKRAKRDWGNNHMGITYISPDFDKPVWSEEQLEEMGF